MGISIRVSATSERIAPRPQRWAVWRRLRRNATAMAGLAIVCAFVAVSLLAPYLAPKNPTQQHIMLRRNPPSRVFLLGNDELGRDVLSRLIYGSRVALSVGVTAVVIGLSLGTSLGLLGGYVGGRVDAVVVGIADIFLAFPQLLLALAIVGALGPSIVNAMIAIGIATMPTYARIVRGAALSVKGREFVEAARACGGTEARIALRHVLPNILSPIIVHSTLYLGRAILSESYLSFLGVGIQPPHPSWGSMIASGSRYVDVSPHLAVFPGLAIMITLLGFNLLGDGLRDALDPRLRTL
jgi:peptide/nickel transport system permease protein